MLRQGVNGLSALGIVVTGGALAVALYQVWQLSTRWVLVVIVAITAVSVALRFVRIFSDFLLVVLFFSLPFTSITTKWANIEGAQWVAGFFSIGLVDFLLAGLYMSWFYRLFVTREQTLPSFNRIDFFILWYITAHLVSTIGCQDPVVALGSTEYLVKNVLFYFYVSRNLEARHIPWLLAAMGFAIGLEVAIGAAQFTTGKLTGLGLDKGAGGYLLSNQDIVPGTEGYSRAAGISYDSHALGHFLALLNPFALVLVLTPGLRRVVRLACMAACAVAVVGIMLSLSRSAWLGSLISVTIGIALMLIYWRERHIVPSIAGLITLAAVITPFLSSYIYERFHQSPWGTLWERVQLLLLGGYIFTLYPIFGVGPANSLPYIYRLDWMWQAPKILHNVILWIAVELGIFGLIPFLAIHVVAAWRLFSLVRRRRDIAGRLALAALIAMMATVLNGMTEPGFREPNVYETFWLLIALSVALPRLPLGEPAVLLSPRRWVPAPARAPRMAVGGAAAADGE